VHRGDSVDEVRKLLPHLDSNGDCLHKFGSELESFRCQREKAIHKLIGAHARDLSGALHEHRVKLYPPQACKTSRSFSSTEAAKLIGVNDGYLRHLSIEDKGPQPEIGNNNRRSYTAETIQP
jgi:hypothetical protein